MELGGNDVAIWKSGFLTFNGFWNSLETESNRAGRISELPKKMRVLARFIGVT
jgi:hypothetical protein